MVFLCVYLFFSLINLMLDSNKYTNFHNSLAQRYYSDKLLNNSAFNEIKIEYFFWFEESDENILELDSSHLFLYNNFTVGLNDEESFYYNLYCNAPRLFLHVELL